MNFCIEHQNLHPEKDLKLLFPGEEVEILPQGTSLLDILVRVGIFPSKGQARKNWKGPVEPPVGMHWWTVGKLRTEIVVHQPPHDLEPWTD